MNLTIVKVLDLQKCQFHVVQLNYKLFENRLLCHKSFCVFPPWVQFYADSMPEVFKVRSVGLYGLWRAFSGPVKIKTIFLIILKCDLPFHSVEICTHGTKPMLSKIAAPSYQPVQKRYCPLVPAVLFTAMHSYYKTKQDKTKASLI